ncbi:gamma-glutamylcyclotransferase family protein [Synechococcus sp. BDU 130192]|uniref:gamma-glutamylcyclotransferase family protein n=1 Tax=Synechococcus sp. BDU 130192 TaxID=2042059 RepID=UPI000C088ECA|nr:gamma-glutamylcyclotransferase family protein [Synechococcus sp. BDU 130192]
MLKVFVYGTLQPGEANFPRYCAPYHPHIEKAFIPGKLYQLPVGYPALTPEPGWVEGCLLRFRDPKVLERLDVLEDYQPGRSPSLNEYQRRQAPVYTETKTLLTEAWVYGMTPEKVAQLGGTPFSGSRWTANQNFSNF